MQEEDKIILTRNIHMRHDEVLQEFIDQLELWWRRNLNAITSPVLKSLFRDVLNDCTKYRKITSNTEFADIALVLDEDELLDEVLIAQVSDNGKSVSFTRVKKGTFGLNFKKIDVDRK